MVYPTSAEVLSQLSAPPWTSLPLPSLYSNCGSSFHPQNMTQKGSQTPQSSAEMASCYSSQFPMQGSSMGPVLLPFKPALSHLVIGQFEHPIQIFLKLLESKEGIIRSDIPIKIWNYLWAWSSQTGKIICVIQRSGCLIPFSKNL